jgi:putative PIN family toxin of toxin-antitoxin system
LQQSTGDSVKVSTPAVVLDTNAVLDWLVFRDPVMAALVRHLEAGTVRWLGCPSMREEFARTLGYRKLQKWSPDHSQALASYDRWVTPADAPPKSASSMRCADPDDQVFIDLALASRARWLISKDRAVLKLARRASPLGVSILQPKDWSPP